MPSKTTRSARARTSLPLPSSKSRSTATPAPSQPRRSRPLRHWRTHGVVDKQSTLTQIDFVRPLRRCDSEDEDLEYEEEEDSKDSLALPEDVLEQPRRKRRKIDVFEDTDANRRKSAPAAAAIFIKDEKENFVQQTLENDDTAEVKRKFQTPRKSYKREVCSSQSPTTPLSIRSTRWSHLRTEMSPLKNLSPNISRQPRLVAEDTYKTNDSVGSNLSRVASVDLELAVPETPSKVRGENARRNCEPSAKPTSKLEILDSDEDISDVETVRSLRSGREPTRHEDSVQKQPKLDPDTDSTARAIGSEADIYRPPVSDDSRDEAQEHISTNLISHEAHIDREADTLDDRLLLKRKRTYSGSRRRSITAAVPSSSISLEELSDTRPVSPQSTATAKGQPIEMPSSPPFYSTKKQPNNGGFQDEETSTDPLQPEMPSSPAVQTDSQQATVQLQQESQWQAPIVPSSQATTASISGSSSPSRGGTRKPAVSAKQGWFFNPLTDSQLLPDSIMNFELPRFPRILRGRRHTGTEGNAAEEQ